MKKLIELGVAIDIAIGAADEYDGGYNFERDRKIRDALMALPTVDAVTVKHGRWLIRRFGSNAKCSECGMYFTNVYDMENSDNYCRHCGAKMDGIKLETHDT